MNRGKFRFHEVESSPEESGVYAWYCRHELSKRNIEELLLELSNSLAPNKPDLVRNFLNKYLFVYFKEEPYEVCIKAPLKPRYEGLAEHKSSISKSLVDRLVEQPARIEVLANILKLAMPEFASPIYIGSAKSIRKRLSRHVALIRKYQEGELQANTSLDDKSNEEKLDHSFAREAALVRRFDPNDLWVHTLEVEIGHKYAFDIENVLNRINFPLCGRN